jgi:hypothetical protein
VTANEVIKEPAVLELLIMNQDSDKIAFTPRRILLEGNKKHRLNDLRKTIGLAGDFVSLEN